MLDGATDHRRALEERVSAEVAKLQAAHKADTERLRQETIGSFTREVNMLREMRDTAVRAAAARRLKMLHTCRRESFCGARYFVRAAAGFPDAIR
jgi:hypothetical protein